MQDYRNINNNISQEKILGMFYPYGGVIEISDYSYDFYLEAVDYFFENREFQIPKQVRERNKISDDIFKKYAQCLTTWSHEAYHLYLFFSSPLSILVHFMLLMRASYMQHICLKNKSANNSITSHCFQCIEAINLLKNTLFGDGYYKMNDILNKVNRFIPYIYQFYQERFSNIREMHRIKTNLHGSAFSSPSKMITPLKLMEGHANILQKMSLANIRTTDKNQDNILHDIIIESMGNVYSDAFDYYRVKLSIDHIHYYHLYTFLLLIEVSFKTPFDPNYISVINSDVWEDLHPSYRFDRLLSFVNRIGFYKGGTDYKEYSDNLCNLVKLPKLSLIKETSEKIKYTRGIDEIGLNSFFDNQIDSLTKYVLKTHRTANIINEKWPYGPYLQNPAHLEHQILRKSNTQSCGARTANPGRPEHFFKANRIQCSSKSGFQPLF